MVLILYIFIYLFGTTYTLEDMVPLLQSSIYIVSHYSSHLDCLLMEEMRSRGLKYKYSHKSTLKYKEFHSNVKTSSGWIDNLKVSLYHCLDR